MERSHHVLGQYLKQFTDRDREWDQWLELAMFSYNTSVHEGTKYTPHELVFGKLARPPSSDPLIDKEHVETYNDYLAKLMTKLHSIQNIARENLIGAKEKSKKYYDRNVNPLTLKKGDFVFLLKGGKIHKLQDQYSGPHEVLEVISKTNVRINMKRKNSRSDNEKGLVVNINRLKKSPINSN